MILNSNGIVTFSSVPTDAPTTNGPTFGRLIDTNTFYYYNGSAWVAITLGSDVAYDETTWNDNLDVPTKNVIRDKFEDVTTNVSSIIVPLKYIALITQAGTSAPTATIIYNTLGEVPTFNYDGVGDYDLVTVAALFTAKTVIQATLVNGSTANLLKVVRTSTTEFGIFTYDLSAVAANLVGSIYLSIEVYP